MKRALLLLAFAAAIAATPAAAKSLISLPATAEGQVTFLMPSGNVECVYTPEGGTAVYSPADGGPELQCDRVAPTYLRFTLGRSGAATIAADVGDQSCCSADNLFPYGTTWSHPPFTCTSATTGLTCTRGGHGFFISKAKVKAY